ncbi:hypothetical protein CY34DRAFT_811089 [Suillus luteus UH-Slu-Lm8-n1]|uniref:Unplaced genomic scaffold CY34scaffold_376, whole genome shotgun sequence n=1 Tax=Suillus luteus UH-Slu-Lm8-n1 TaxID=930992 RepID=A0A0D0A4X5_9AGAM|nr:hypothetical protein CY34DRAFT_811089 [Suillus luteus UH-Slu-Lm8-n1]
MYKTNSSPLQFRTNCLTDKPRSRVCSREDSPHSSEVWKPWSVSKNNLSQLLGLPHEHHKWKWIADEDDPTVIMTPKCFQQLCHMIGNCCLMSKKEKPTAISRVDR